MLQTPVKDVYKRQGDTLTEGEKLHFKGIPSFSPELFKYIENADPMKSKQLAKGIDQLMDEGVAQLFVNQFNGRKIIGTVEALQFEVIEYRLLHEYGSSCRWERLNLYKACWIEALDNNELIDFKKHKAQYLSLIHISYMVPIICIKEMYRTLCFLNF